MLNLNKSGNILGVSKRIHPVLKIHKAALARRESPPLKAMIIILQAGRVEGVSTFYLDIFF